MPLMRPMTPASVGPSHHQIEHQLMEAQVNLETFTAGLAANFEMMRHEPMATLTSPSLDQSTCSQPLRKGDSGLYQSTPALPQREEMDLESKDSREDKSSEHSGCGVVRRDQPIALSSLPTLGMGQERQLTKDLSNDLRGKEKRTDRGSELANHRPVAPSPSMSTSRSQQPSEKEGKPHSPHQTANLTSSQLQDQGGKELDLTRLSRASQENRSIQCGEVECGACGSEEGEEVFRATSCRQSTRGSR